MLKIPSWLAWIVLGFIGIALSQVQSNAQQPSPAPDPRPTQQTIAALEAVLTLREAELKAVRQDSGAAQTAYEARLTTAMEWLKAAQGPAAPVAQAAEPPK